MDLKQRKSEDFIEESFARFTRENCKGFFIWYVPDSVFIGTTKLDNISLDTRSAWDGIMIGDKRYQRRGLAQKVYRLLLSYAFQVINLNRINGGCNEKNIPMIRTFYRLGYSLEGRLREADLINGDFSDHLYFGILKREFLKTTQIKLEIK